MNGEPLIEAANEGNKFLWNKPIAHETAARASIWTDTNIYNELGIPSVKIGPRGYRIGPRAGLPPLCSAAAAHALPPHIKGIVFGGGVGP